MHLLIAGAIAVILGIVFLNNGDFEGHKRGNSNADDAIMNFLPALFVLMGILCFVQSSIISKSYINVYDDHIEGAALSAGGFTVKKFHFTKDMRYTVQQDGAAVKVSCGGKVYRIKLTAADAGEVYHCAVNSMASSAVSPAQKTAYSSVQNTATRPVNRVTTPVTNQTAPAQNILIRCPSCDAPMKIPAGKGTIRLTCPKCKKIFQAKS